MGLRLFIGFCVSLVLWFAALALLHIPIDRFLPPAASISHMTMKATGYVQNAKDSTYGDHLLSGGTDTTYFENYKFQPKIPTRQPDGTYTYADGSAWQFGQIQINEQDFNKIKTSDPVAVSYDPLNPLLNGISGTGKINLAAGIWSAWIWYLVGFIASTILIGEIAKKWIISDIN